VKLRYLDFFTPRNSLGLGTSAEKAMRASPLRVAFVHVFQAVVIMGIEAGKYGV